MIDEACPSCSEKRRSGSRSKRKELTVSCMLNTEVGAVLAVMRRPPDPNYGGNQEELYDSAILQSLKSLRGLIFNPHQEWRQIDPSIYISPFLDVIQCDDVPVAATTGALSSVLKILELQVFDEKTPGARDAMNSIVWGLTSCRLEKSDPAVEDAAMMKILQVLTGIMKHSASVLLTDQAVCTTVNTCFQVVQQSANRSDLLQRNARHTMHELVQIIYSRLSDLDGNEADDLDHDGESNGGYGLGCAVDIFQFLCSLLNVMQVVETEGSTYHTSDEDVQIFGLVLINSAIELCGDGIGRHPRLLRMIKDDLFHHLIHYGTCSSPLLLSMICSTVLNLYHFLRRYIRLQLEAFFSYVLLRTAASGSTVQLQEVALEGIISFIRQPTFILEAYVNYDCDPIRRNVFEEAGRLLCRHSFPGSGGPLTSLQLQAFEGLVIIVHNISDGCFREGSGPFEPPQPVYVTDYKPFYEEIPKEDVDTWVEHIRLRKAQKKKLMIAADHFNRDEKKGLDYLKLCQLVGDPQDPKVFASFFRYTPGLDKNMLGDYLGDPDDFHLQVLKDFTDTFEFSGMTLDYALRTFLETFRLPGESQKIQRILEAFSERFYDQQSSQIFVSKDAVFVLCYSVIMLNTDQHNVQVKKKMTEEEFIRNNRAINGGQDLPREYLSDLFHSISTNAITIFGQNGLTVEMNQSRWMELINHARTVQPFFHCDFDSRLGRDMFACIAGPITAALSAFFEHVEEDALLHECIEGIVSVARVAQYGLEDILDELVASFCKFTTLLNPYASAEETLFAFSNDLKPRMATLVVFTIANSFGNSIRGGWRNIIDCLLKLKKLKLLPQSITEEAISAILETESRSESGAGHDSQFTTEATSSIVNRFSSFLSVDNMEESVSLGMSEFERNLKVIKQCQIGSIFSNTSNLPIEALLSLGRSIIFAAAGKGQKFSTPIEEEETVGFCWDLVTIISAANVHRFMEFWPAFGDYLIGVAQLPLFSPVPFAEKGIISLLKVSLKLLSSVQSDKTGDDFIFKSIMLMWRFDKEVLDTCSEFIMQSVSKILRNYAGNLQTQMGWRSVLHLLSVTGRHQETYDQAVDTLIILMTEATHLSRINFPYCIDSAFGFIALKNSPLEKNLTLLDLMADATSSLTQWYKVALAEQAMYSISSMSSSSGMPPMPHSMEESFKNPSYIMTLFVKLGDAFKKTSLARREEVRNHAVICLRKSFELAEALDFSSTNCMNCINLVIFAMVDDLHEKMLEYSRRDHAEKEMRSMEMTLNIAMELLTDVFLQFLKVIVENPGFRTFWLGVLRRMDTCMKADLGQYGATKLQEVVPDLLRRVITTMQETGILVKKEGEDLWEITYIQIQWIAPALKDELFPGEF